MFILLRNSDGAIVARSGEAHSYTRDIRRAQIFPSAEAARRGACGNEHAVEVSRYILGEQS